MVVAAEDLSVAEVLIGAGDIDSILLPEDAFPFAAQGLH